MLSRDQHILLNAIGLQGGADAESSVQRDCVRFRHMPRTFKRVLASLIREGYVERSADNPAFVTLTHRGRFAR
jgi:hypothetical protein